MTAATLSYVWGLLTALCIIVVAETIRHHNRPRVWCLHEHEGWVGLVPRDVLDANSRSFWIWRERGGNPTEDATLAYRMDGYGAFRMRPLSWNVIYLRSDNPKLQLLLDGLNLERREFFMVSPRREQNFAEAYRVLHGRPVPPEVVNAIVAV